MQQAIDAATTLDGATVKIAGTCTGVSTVGGTVQTAKIAKNLTLEGGYASDSWDVSDPVAHPTTLDADNAGRGVYVATGATVTLRNLNIAHGSGGSNGGGIYNAGTVTLERSTVRDSAAGQGGGIYNLGSLTVLRSLLTGNTASSQGAGIYSPSTATLLVISNSTLANNTATTQGGAIWSQAPASTLGSPRWRATAPQPAAALPRRGADRPGHDPGQQHWRQLRGHGALQRRLQPRQRCHLRLRDGQRLAQQQGSRFGRVTDHGGPTLTFEPPLYGYAHNRGDLAYVPPSGDTDQRGLTRVRGGRIDIGAVEVQSDVQVLCRVKVGATEYVTWDASAVQQAIDAATTLDGATVKIAGTCTGVGTVGGTVQTAKIAKNLTLEGGYASDSWDVSDPVAHPTTLDADNAGRGVYVATGATVTLRNLNIAHGSGGSNGGGIYNAGTVTLERSTVRDSAGGSGRRHLQPRQPDGPPQPADGEHRQQPGRRHLQPVHGNLAGDLQQHAGEQHRHHAGWRDSGARRPRARWGSPRWRATAPQPAAGSTSPRR